MNSPIAADIRRAEPKDTAALLSLFEEHAGYEGARITMAGKAEAMTRALSGPDPRLFVWVAEVEGVLVGYASASFEFSTWGICEYLHMDCLYLREQARNRGLGAALLEALIAFASERGCREMQWQTPDWNVDAARFYRRMGARQLSKLRFVLALEDDHGSKSA